ncbi:seizure 6-like protein [Anolis carolinensis]|uniref:seizure 6-like protein n=1 Tax=Anolis carolinensis TaxID=28377 RepID=UPI002F2B28ED
MPSFRVLFLFLLGSGSQAPLPGEAYFLEELPPANQTEEAGQEVTRPWLLQISPPPQTEGAGPKEEGAGPGEEGGGATLTPSHCGVNFFDPEGFIDSGDYPPLLRGEFLECTYNVTVYTGYGVELQVKSVNLSEGEVLSIGGWAPAADRWAVLANQSLLVEGQVIRSLTNSISVFFRTFPDDAMGTFQLHYQVFVLSCGFPRRPENGEVTVLGLHPGGVARFHCHLGYEVEGPALAVCTNASRPHWSAPPPLCIAPCGGRVRNATVGRILSPTHVWASNVSCEWSVVAPKSGQKLHLHFEKMALRTGQRLQVFSGVSSSSSSSSLLLFDSAEGPGTPFEGLISQGDALALLFLQSEADPEGDTGSPAFNIRFEAFERGHCYEPFIQNGNYSTSDPTFDLGAVVEFTCDPGHDLEHGHPAALQCVNLREPHWNDTEPICRASCGGELTGGSGVIVPPDWPEEPFEPAPSSSSSSNPVGESGRGCVWKIHVSPEKRVRLDIQLLNLSGPALLSVFDGDDLGSRPLGHFLGSSLGSSPGSRRLYGSSPDLTVQFNSDPDAGPAHKAFLITYAEVARNDSCPDLPEIQNGWKTTSHAEPNVRGAKVTYQCDPGYDVLGPETLVCTAGLAWSSPPPFCEKIMYCTDPGEVAHATRLISDAGLLVGTTIQYTCVSGFVLEGSSALLTCYSRETGTPSWTSRLPTCVPEESLACENPGLPENGYQILYKRLYLPGESLTFMCYEGFVLEGEVAIECTPGTPSRWSGPLPTCKVNQDTFEHALEVAATSLEGGNMALAIFLPVLVVSLLLGGAYIYITRCRSYSSLRLPLIYSHPYSQITVETEFDNPIYETGETREYEVSI